MFVKYFSTISTQAETTYDDINWVGKRKMQVEPVDGWKKRGENFQVESDCFVASAMV